MLKIRNVEKDDLFVVTKIEQQCFPIEEAATMEIFEERIRIIPDSFLVAEINGIIAGLINGPVIEKAVITDDLFFELKANPASGGHQSVLGLAVSPEFQKQGVASALLKQLEKVSREKGRETITLTCKGDLISYYEGHGFVNHGVADSHHGGAVWYNMIKKL